MKESNVTISCTSVWDEKKQHRFLFVKTWDEKKPKALVISKSAGVDDGIEQTVTQVIISNNLNSLGYGGFALCNLISDVNGKSVSPNNLKVIEEQVKSGVFKTVILCWGADEKFPDSLQKEIANIVNVLKKAKSDNVVRISDGVTNNCCHPLSPKVRNSFFLVPIKL